jgi:hypothetical protein
LQSRSQSRSKTIPEKSAIDFDPAIDPRFSDQNRSAFFIFKSISVFHFQIDQRLKNGFMAKSTDGMRNRIPIFVRKSIGDFETTISIMISIKNRSGKIGDRF